MVDEFWKLFGVVVGIFEVYCYVLEVEFLVDFCGGDDVFDVDCVFGVGYIMI